MVLRILITLFTTSIIFTQVEISEVVFKGNKSFKSKILNELLKTEIGEEYRSYYVNADKLTIKNFYEANGFIDVEVRSELQSLQNKFTEKRLLFIIRENWRYYFGNITVNGNLLFTKNELLSEFSAKKGDPYQVQLISDWIAKIIQKYKNNGKPFINVEPMTSIADENRFNIDINLKIDEKNTVYFRNLKIQSSDTTSLVTDTNLIRNEFEFKKGDKYSIEKIEETRKYLYRTGIFQNVDFQATELKTSLTDTTRVDSVDMRLLLRERKRYYAGASLGLSTAQDQYIFLKSDNQKSIFKNMSYDLEVEFGKRNFWEGSGANIGFVINPVFALDDEDNFRVFSSKYRMILSFLNQPFHRFKSYLNFSYHILSHPNLSSKLNRFTGNYTTSYQISDISFLNFGLTVDNNSEDSIDNPITLTEDQKRRLGFLQSNVFSISSTYRIDKRDHYIVPNNGYVINAKIAASVTTNEDERVDFYTFRFDWKRYQPFFSGKNLTFASNLSLAAIVSNAKLKSIPKASRFYSSGLMRGFNNNSPHGPQIQVYEPTSKDSISYLAEGGKYMFVLNMELRKKVYDEFYAQLFVDIGGLWRELSDVNVKNLRLSYGLGLSYNLDFLVLRFEYGIKLRRRDYDVLDPVFPNIIERDSSGEFSFGFSYHF